MLRRLTRTVIAGALLAGVLAHAPIARAEVTGDPPEATLNRLIDSGITRNFDEFLIDMNDDMRAGVTKQRFDAVCNMYAPHLKAGYKTSYLGKLRQQGHVVYLWRLEFSDGKDDVLVKLAVKNAKISGFWYQ